MVRSLLKNLHLERGERGEREENERRQEGDTKREIQDKKRERENRMQKIKDRKRKREDWDREVICVKSRERNIISINLTVQNPQHILLVVIFVFVHCSQIDGLPFTQQHLNIVPLLLLMFCYFVVYSTDLRVKMQIKL